MNTETTPKPEGLEQLTDAQRLHIRELQLKRVEAMLQIKDLESVMASIRNAESRISKEIEDYVFSIFGSDRVILDSDLNATRVK